MMWGGGLGQKREKKLNGCSPGKKNSTQQPGRNTNFLPRAPQIINGLPLRIHLLFVCPISCHWVYLYSICVFVNHNFNNCYLIWNQTHFWPPNQSMGFHVRLRYLLIIFLYFILWPNLCRKWIRILYFAFRIFYANMLRPHESSNLLDYSDGLPWLGLWGLAKNTKRETRNTKCETLLIDMTNDIHDIPVYSYLCISSESIRQSYHQCKWWVVDWVLSIPGPHYLDMETFLHLFVWPTNKPSWYKIIKHVQCPSSHVYMHLTRLI